MTVAFGMAAPLESRTLPVKSPLFACANAETEKIVKHVQKTHSHNENFFIFPFPHKQNLRASSGTLKCGSLYANLAKDVNAFLICYLKACFYHFLDSFGTRKRKTGGPRKVICE